MSSVLRTVLGVGIALALLTAILFWRPAWLLDLGFDPGQVLDDAEALNRADQRAQALESWRELVQNKIQTKEIVLQGLIEGRLTLLEAGAHLKPLVDATRPRARQAFWRAQRGNSDEERLCRHLIDCVRDSLQASNPARAEQEVARLEAELQEHLQHGPLAFPPLPTQG